MAVQRRAELAFPDGIACLAKLQEQVELLGEEFVICPCVQAEERKGLAERTTTDDKLGAPSGNQVEGRELLEESYRIGGAQYRYRARQSNLAGARRCCRKYDCRCGIEKFGAMMFADAEYVEPDPVGDLYFLKKIGHAVGRRRELSRRRIRKDRGKTVDTNFHEGSFETLWLMGWPRGKGAAQPLRHPISLTGIAVAFATVSAVSQWPAASM